MTQSVSFFDRLWPQVSSLVIALILFFVGVLVDRMRRRKKEKKLYVSLLRSIYYDYKKNLDLLCQLHAYLFLAILPSFSLELSRKDALVQTLVPVCLNFKLLDNISDGYFELVHIQNRLDHLSRSAATDKWSPLLRGTYQLIHNDIRFVFGIMKLIAQEMRRIDPTGSSISSPSEDDLKERFDKWQQDPDIVKISQRSGADLSTRERFYEEGFSLRTEQSGCEEP